MPKPKAGEKKADYIPRCISYMVRKEGRKRDQAIAICHSMWRRKDKK